MPELKPCPFCGGAPELIIESSFDATGLYAVENYYKIACTRCFACSGKIGYKEMAIAAWNRRATEVLSTNEAANRIGITTIASASYWLDVIRHLEELGLKICEVKNME